MLAWIGNIYGILKALLELFKYIKQWQEEQRKKEVLEKELALDAALKQLEEAKTDDEIFAAQELVARLRPRK